MTAAYERIGTFLQEVVLAALNGGSPFVCNGEKFSREDVRRGLVDVLSALDHRRVGPLSLEDLYNFVGLKVVTTTELDGSLVTVISPKEEKPCGTGSNENS